MAKKPKPPPPPLWAVDPKFTALELDAIWTALQQYVDNHGTADEAESALAKLNARKAALVEPTVVVFRVWRDAGTVLALFPHEKGDHSGHCACYERVGQHGAADYTGCVAKTRPATEAEAAPLKAELESLGYTLKVQQRR